ncbi:Site-specific recombinase XerD [Prevotella sp. kh1p2]|nr:Site-specific recombinase XerD [Prevotella sp. kh1p2]SNU11434.1 Site-specific recombinase XerD [Prevotellaceae bacterium KH2P17]
MLSHFMNTAAQGASRSTKDNYKTAVHSFIRFNNNKDIPISAINKDILEKYERWLRQQGVCANTSSCYLRSLRAIYNKAAGRHLLRRSNPFANVFTGNETTDKRGIGIADIRKLRQLELPEHSFAALARDIFLFSFYAMGMPFVDVANLKRSQIKDRHIVYYRRKTGKKIRVRIEPCMLDIINKYKRESGEYVFPILNKVEESRRNKKYASSLRHYNATLKKLSAKAGLNVRLSSYVARHSWASIAYARNIDLPIISKALGHTDTQTTLIYISQINDRSLALANKKLLNELFAPPLGKRWKHFIKSLQR